MTLHTCVITFFISVTDTISGLSKTNNLYLVFLAAEEVSDSSLDIEITVDLELDLH